MSPDCKNKFAWSVSRDSVFNECSRKYWFQYYGFWGGWADIAPPRTRELYMLKKLKSRWMWVGQIVHECIARSLKNLSRGVPLLDVPEILKITRGIMRQQFRESRDGRYRQNAKYYCGLFEHEYEMDLLDADWREAAEHADRCLLNFYDSPHFAELKDLDPAYYLEIESNQKIYIDGDEIFFKLDLATRTPVGITVWDWKTGRSEGDAAISPQLACYGYYAQKQYSVLPAQVTVRRYDLYRNQMHEGQLSKAKIEETVAYIKGSAKDMRAMLVDPDENIPMDEERFRKEEKESVCLRCNFLRVCKPNL